MSSLVFPCLTLQISHLFLLMFNSLLELPDCLASLTIVLLHLLYSSRLLLVRPLKRLQFRSKSIVILLRLSQRSLIVSLVRLELVHLFKECVSLLLKLI